MNDSILYYGAMGVAVAILVWIGTVRDRKTHEAMRSFAARNGLNFRPQQLFKGVSAETSGPYQGWNILIGSFFVSGFQKGIGPAEKESQLEARLELPEGIEPDLERLRILHREEGIGFSGRSLRISFPKRYLKPISYHEIEQAIGRLIAAAEKVGVRK